MQNFNMAAIYFQKQHVVMSRPCSETFLSKFGVQIVFDFLKCDSSPNWKPEVDCGENPHLRSDKIPI